MFSPNQWGLHEARKYPSLQIPTESQKRAEVGIDVLLRHVPELVARILLAEPLDVAEAVRAKLPVDLQVAVTIEHTYGWRCQSEVLTLERRQLDLEAGTLRLDPGTTKNDDGRLVYLTPVLKALLVDQLGRVKALERQLGRVIPFLFPHLKGSDPNTAWPGPKRTILGAQRRDFRRAWVTACKKAGAPGMLRHNFRRTAVRNLVASHVSERVAMTITGHKTRSVFDRYHIVSDGELREASRKLVGITTGITAMAPGKPAR